MTTAPLHDKLVISPAVKENKTASGLILAGYETSGPIKGTVVAAGQGRMDKGTRCVMDAQVGDEVFYVQGGELDTGDGTDSIFLAEDNVVARMVDDTFVPYWDKALIRLIKEERITAAGLVLTADKEDGYDTGEVLAVGPGYVKEGLRGPMELSVGDRVYFNQFMGVEIEIDAEDSRRLFLVREYDVYCILK